MKFQTITAKPNRQVAILRHPSGAMTINVSVWVDQTHTDPGGRIVREGWNPSELTLTKEELAEVKREQLQD